MQQCYYDILSISLIFIIIIIFFKKLKFTLINKIVYYQKSLNKMVFIYKNLNYLL